MSDAAQILKLPKNSFTYISVYTWDDLLMVKNEKFTARAPVIVYWHEEESTRNFSRQFKTLHKIPAYHRFIWIVITANDLFEELATIYIPLNCQFILCRKSQDDNFNLIEFYKTSDSSKLYSNGFGTWDSSSGFIDLIPNNFLYRRMNFHLQQIRVNKQTDITGGIFARLPEFLPEAWEKVSERLNISSNYTSKNFDIDINSNALLGPSGPDHEYIHVLFNVQINLFYREVETKFGLTSYLNPFSGYVWILIIAWTIVTSCFMSFIMIKTPSKTERMQANLAWRILDVLAILSQQDMVIGSNSDATRIIAALHFLSSMIFFGVYSAVFISFIAVDVHKSPFDELSLEGILRQGEYKILVVRNKAYPFFLNNHHSTVRALFERQLPPYEQQPVTFMEGFDQVCYSPHKYLTEFPPAAIDDLKPKLKKCKISQDSIFLNSFPGTWLFKRGSPYKNVIQLSMLKLTESGAVSNNIIFRKLFLKKITERDVLDPIEIGQVISLFAAFGFGLALSILFLVVERMFLERKNWNWLLCQS